ncbi:protein NUCLEAR FUSION DEFECTIVE 4 [Humulus lupulus]|uniref:protein NUCLEAR FUSION DEFECTIVE 4 n=1 Tax=Humulus lupulus TaxID=3486 RepID=UPI002B414499|nr:protein NUCLEAR FUSION DEFECTIVE 4 [Humulus lupulus]
MPSGALQWLSLVGIIWLQAINGTNTNFPAYSSQLKHVFSMTQLQLNNLAFASDAGKLFGWFSGIAAVYLPLWLVLLIGSLLGLTGYGLQYLSLTNHISSLSYLQIFVLTVLAGNSICWLNTVSYVVAIRNFPRKYRQIAVGLTTSYQGLSAKIYTDVAGSLFSSAVSSSSGGTMKGAQAYLLLNSALPLIVTVITAPFVKEMNVTRPGDMNVGFVVMFFITIATGVYAVISSLGLIMSTSALKRVIGTCVFLLAPLVIPVAEKLRQLLEMYYCSVNRETRVYHFTIDENGMEIEIGRDGHDVSKFDGDHQDQNGREVVINGQDDRDQDHGDNGDDGDDVGVREEIGVKKMLLRIDFWLYFFAYFFSATLGLVFLNNLGQIAESRGSNKTSSLVSLSSSFGFFGRLMPSLLDHYFSRRKSVVSRPALIAALVAPMGGAFFLLLNSTNIALYTSTATIGVCTGAITSISVSTTTELFGAKNFSVNHNVLVANIPIGSFVFGYLAALLYHQQGNGDGKCLGTKCYRDSFLIWGSLCFLGTILAIILCARTRKFYSQR